MAERREAAQNQFGRNAVGRAPEVRAGRQRPTGVDADRADAGRTGAVRADAGRSDAERIDAEREENDQVDSDQEDDQVGTVELTAAVQQLGGAYIDDRQATPIARAAPGVNPDGELNGTAAGGDGSRDRSSVGVEHRSRDRPTPTLRNEGRRGVERLSRSLRNQDSAPYGMVHGGPLTVGALAERLGIASSTLRSWDRRYGLGPTDHRAGDRRRYGPADVVRLERMRALTLAGVSPADAARSVTRRPGGYSSIVPASISASSLDVQSLAAAAAAGDQADVRLAIARHADAHGWSETWRRLLAPTCEVLAILPEPSAPGSDGITVLTDLALEVVRTTALTHVSDERVRVVIHTAPKHVLAAHVLAGALSEKGVATLLRRVGRHRVPAGAIEDIAGRSDEVAVVVGFGRAASARALAGTAAEKRPAVVLVGPGLPRQVPPEAVLASDLASAVSTVTALLADADLA